MNTISFAAATDGHSPAKEAKTGSSKPTNKTTGETRPSKPSKKTTRSEIKQPSSQAQDIPKRPRQTAKSIKLTEAWLKDLSIGPGPINLATRLRIPHPSGTSTEIVGKTPLVKKEPVAKKALKVKQEPTLRVEKSLKKEPGVGKESKPKKEAKVKKESMPKTSSTIKHEPNADWSLAPNPLSLGLINGIYDLSCPEVSRNWPCENLTLNLTLDGTAVWGAYDLEAFSGTLFLLSRRWQASNNPLPFTWRGRKSGEGQMSFGYGCDGELSFLGNGEIEGWISVYGRCEFRGVRRTEAGDCGEDEGEYEGGMGLVK